MADFEFKRKLAQARARAAEATPEAAPMPMPEEPAALTPQSVSGTALRSFGQGASMGFADELRGLSGVLQEASSRGPAGAGLAALAAPLSGPAAIASAANAGRAQGEFSDLPLLSALAARYRSDRDAQRRDVAAGAKANPGTAAASEIAGALTVPTSGAKTLAGRLGGYGLQGAAQGVGQSSTLENIPAEAAKSAAVSLVGGGLGEGLMAVARPLVRRGAGVVGDIVQGKQAQIADDVAKEVASLKGAYGAETQKGSRYLENVQRGVSGVPSSSVPSGISPQTQAQAIQSLNSPEAAALQTSVLENTMDALPAQAAAIEKAKVAYQAAAQGAPQEVAVRTQRYFNAPILSNEVIPRLDRLKARLGTGAIGAAVGAPAGALYGLATGEDPSRKAAEFSALLGAGGLLQPTGLLSMVRNVSNSPRVQAAAVEGSLRGIQGAASLAPRAGAVANALRDDEKEGINAFLDGAP